MTEWYVTGVCDTGSAHTYIWRLWKPGTARLFVVYALKYVLVEPVTTRYRPTTCVCWSSLLYVIAARHG